MVSKQLCKFLVFKYVFDFAVGPLLFKLYSDLKWSRDFWTPCINFKTTIFQCSKNYGSPIHVRVRFFIKLSKPCEQSRPYL